MFSMQTRALYQSAQLICVKKADRGMSTIMSNEMTEISAGTSLSYVDMYEMSTDYLCVLDSFSNQRVTGRGHILQKTEAIS